MNHQRCADCGHVRRRGQTRRTCPQAFRISHVCEYIFGRNLKCNYVSAFADGRTLTHPKVALCSHNVRVTVVTHGRQRRSTAI